MESTICEAARRAKKSTFFSFATGQSKRIITLPGRADAWFGGMTVSPDRRWIVFSQRQYSSSEILFADNVR
jgi:hypothetical protein